MGVKQTSLLTEPRRLRSGTQALPGVRTDYGTQRLKSVQAFFNNLKLLWQPVAEVAGRSQTCPTEPQIVDRL